MGYSLRSWDYRYTLWLGFNPKTFQVCKSHKCTAWKSSLICLWGGCVMEPSILSGTICWRHQIIFVYHPSVSSRWMYLMSMLESCTCWQTTLVRTRTSIVSLTTVWWWERWPACLMWVYFKAIAISHSFASFIDSLTCLLRFWLAVAVQTVSLQMRMRLQLLYLTAGMKTSRRKAWSWK